MERKRHYYRNITRRLLVIIFVLSVVPIISFGFFANSAIEQTSVVKLRERTEATAEHRAQVISMFLDEKIRLLRVLVSIYPEEYLLHLENLQQLFLALAQKRDIVDLQVIDSGGMQHGYVGPYSSMIAGKRYNDAPWFTETLIHGVHVSDVFMGYRNVPHFVVAVTSPLKRYVLRATINSSLFHGLLFSAQLGPHGDAYIVNRQGAFQTPSLQGISTLPQEEQQFLVNDGKSVLVRNADDIYAGSWIAEGRWLLIVRADINDSLDHYRYLRSQLILLVVSICLLAMLGASFAGYAIAKNLEKSDREEVAMNLQLAQVEKMASVGRLAAGIAHEINNPLQMITNQAGWIGELLVDEDPALIKNYDEYQQAVDKIKYHVRRAGTITHRLLGFSHKIHVQQKPVDIGALLEEAVSFLEKEASYNNIAIRLQVEDNLPFWEIDGSQLQQVFLNLMNNSIDAVIRNGAVEIGACRDKEGALVISFADNGPGIPVSNLQQIFDPFFTTKEPGKGTGLGLYISYDIVQKLGGTLRATNRKGGGALFTLRIPRTGDR